MASTTWPRSLPSPRTPHLTRFSQSRIDFDDLPAGKGEEHDHLQEEEAAEREEEQPEASQQQGLAQPGSQGMRVRPNV